MTNSFLPSSFSCISDFQKYFSQSEILTLLTSEFYSVLYYCSESWLIPALKPELKQMLLAASAKALKTSQVHPGPMESYINIHKLFKRALQSQHMHYKHAILLHKLYNDQIPEADWVELNLNQILTSCQSPLKFQNQMYTKSATTN